MKENNQIVSLAVAELAKEKGFDNLTDFAYCFDTTQGAYYVNYDPEYFQNSNLWEKHIAAPTREQLQIWLQKNQIFVIVNVDQTFEPKFAYKISQHLGNGVWDNNEKWSDLFYRYEQALEAGLLEGLSKIK